MLKHFSIALILSLSTETFGQQLDGTFEKQGRFPPLEESVTRRLTQQGLSSYEGPQPFDMLHYRLNLTLAMVSADLGGKCTMIMRLKSAVDSLVLHAVSLSLDTVRVDGVMKSYSANQSAETFTIYLNGTRNAGDTLSIEIAYRRLPTTPRPNSRQGYYFFLDTLGMPSNLGYTFSEPSDARFWFPCYDEPWEKATAEIIITVPTGFVAGSNGRLLGTTNNGNGTSTWRWRENHQIATYLMCMTVSGFSVSTIPYITSSNDTLPLQYFTWAGDSADSHAFLPTVREMMRAFAGLFGEYPFDKYGMTAIVPFTYLGMEHQTLTTMNRFYRTSQRVAAHELAHQWWGNLVTCGTWPDIWLNESFATYGEALWREHQGGFPALRSYMRDTLSEFQFVSWQGAVYDPVGQGFNLFSPVVYTKGGWVLHTLRGVLGDSLFFRALNAYRERFAGKSAITSELVAVVDSVAGQDMSWFFNQWIFGVGWPKYATRHSWSADSLFLTIYQLQSLSWPTFRMPIRIRAYYGSSDTTFIVVDSLRTQSFTIPLAVQPDSVALDPDGWILKQIVPPTKVEGTEEMPSAFRLHQNYPNPFNPKTSFKYEVPSLELVTLKVFDILGREVVTLVNDEKEPGTYEVKWDASNLASGVYFYRLQTANFVDTKKLIMLK